MDNKNVSEWVQLPNPRPMTWAKMEAWGCYIYLEFLVVSCVDGYFTYSWKGEIEELRAKTMETAKQKP